MADRKDFYFRQRVTQAELDEAFSELEAADRALMAEVLGSGFLITGTAPATVTENSPQALNVLMNHFVGYDQLGRRLSNFRSAFLGGTDLGSGLPQTVDISTDENGASTTVAVNGNERIVSIFIEFTRNPLDARLDGNGQNVFFDQDESIKINIVQSAEVAIGGAVPPPLRGDQLLSDRDWETQ